MMLIRTTAILALVLLLVIVPSAAQDATPTEAPSETPLPTLTPTDLPTSIPTAVATETPTASPTLVPTETPTMLETPMATAAVTETATETATADSFQTASPSPTLIETPTETATSAADTPSPLPTLTAMTLPGEPELGLLYADNFEVGNTFAWNLGVGWSLATYPQGQVLQLLSSDASATLLSDPLSNVAAQVLFQLNTGTLFLGARDGYRAVVDTQGLVRLYRSGQELASAFVGATPAGQWRTLRLSVMGAVLRVAVDGLAVITLQDPTPLPPGRVSMGGDSSSSFLVADFDLHIPMDELRERSREKGVTSSAAVSALAASAGDNQMSVMSLSGMSQIIFKSNQDGNDEIYSISADGSNPQRLTVNNDTDEEPAWSFDDSQIVFTAYFAGTGYEIFAMNADGSNLRRLTNNAVYDTDPVWSPDGTKIAFKSTRNGLTNIYVMNADGSNVQRLSPLPPANKHPDEWAPSWSSTNQIAFTSDVDGDDEIYIMNADGSNVRQLTNNVVADYRPDWSPDGTRIAYSSKDSSYWTYLNTMNADGSNIHQLTPSSTWHDSSPSWSPDGSQIAFMSTRDNASTTEIYTVCAITSIDPAPQLRITNNTWLDYAPAWSHTGTVPALPCVTPTPTPTIIFATNTPQPTPVPIIWYVTCSGPMAPDRFLRIHTEPSASSPVLNEQLAAGSQVYRVDLTTEQPPNETLRFVPIHYPVPNSATQYWVALMDNEGFYLSSTRDTSCPAPTMTPTPSATPMATATPDPNIPLYNPGRFDDNINFSIQSIFNTQPPAVAGAYGRHLNNTVDVVPKDSERCLDTSTSNNLSQCDPPNGIPIYSPVSGCAIRNEWDNTNVIIIENCEGLNTLWNDDQIGPFNGRREISLAHIDPNTSEIGVTAAGAKQANLVPVTAGQYIGTICSNSNKATCLIADETETHLAVQIRFYKGYRQGNVYSTADEILGFLATPNCLFDDWANIPGNPTINPNPLRACPQY